MQKLTQPPAPPPQQHPYAMPQPTQNLLPQMQQAQFGYSMQAMPQASMAPRQSNQNWGQAGNLGPNP